MHHIFTHKKILICITGSIAVYKMLDCISHLYKCGAHIKVIMSQEACKFVNPLSFEALSRNIVLSESTQSWASEAGEVANHISYAKWADVVLIAPASANSIAKLACGIADSVLLSAILASNAPKILAPAMNTAMLEAPQTQNNIATLAQMGYEIIPPRADLLVCGEQGSGALAELDEIIFALAKAFLVHSFWAKRPVLITGGGSKEGIDQVRYISNHSSGKQASALALAFYALGAEVCFISSAFPIKLPLAIKRIHTQSLESFDQAIHSELEKLSKTDKKPILLMAAALADYAPHIQTGKLKKEQVGKTLMLPCYQTKDILAQIPKHLAYKVGFKAELDETHALKHAQAMLESKGCEMVCLNVINEQNPFGSECNSIKLITKSDTQTIEGSKFEVALGIAQALQGLIQA
ncbi:bifunctional phosphopantothenoylcysteine decarboxylase/phosphopantothenate--cysteine ligase CoaBC [Helicobacter marmotae]|uniref:Coenzyme A biosynthesis bifunctional protein CoaBC n=1 Tax=Helicobacter marmotae TaxID=152490 RepID=A0A3D8I5P4_9HELI|nr:bifunctional phosphopantothenoylcysteine decarboxylase/phosphopantothenate--cysteine ligase CoaBC [Helicobacter marmotae]RDU60326.1 bifunctional phosphopantothenoylcysteine decarboxylase/phosphopantothenate--cysteine ligase CoaBC [Helicobacter marmotae]